MSYHCTVLSCQTLLSSVFCFVVKISKKDIFTVAFSVPVLYVPQASVFISFFVGKSSSVKPNSTCSQ